MISWLVGHLRCLFARHRKPQWRNEMYVYRREQIEEGIKENTG